MVAEEAVRVTLVTEQVKSAGGAIAMSGKVMFWATVTDAEPIQPFEGSVTVTKYVPGELTVLVAEVLPPPQS
jgi:hypothetical protein